MSLFLIARLVGYGVFGAVAGSAEWAAFDPTTGLLTLDTDSIANALVGQGGLGIAGYIGTVALSRIAKAKGGAT